MEQIQRIKTIQEEIQDRAYNFINKEGKVRDYKDSDGCTSNVLGNKKELFFRCPCCSYFNYVSFNLKNDYYHREYYNKRSHAVWKIYKGFILHLCAKIRLSGDEEHIKLFINIFGKEITKRKFEEWAKKSQMIAIRLNLVLKQLRK